MCHFDFCNSLLFGLPSQQIQRLQLIKNSAARLVTRTKKHDSISSVLRNLHWLPIQSRINFKVLLFAYQCFHQFGPSYLVELLTQYKPERTLYTLEQKVFILCPSNNDKIIRGKDHFRMRPLYYGITCLNMLET